MHGGTLNSVDGELSRGNVRVTVPGQPSALGPQLVDTKYRPPGERPLRESFTRLPFLCTHFKYTYLAFLKLIAHVLCAIGGFLGKA